MQNVFKDIHFIENTFSEIKNHPQVVIDMRYATAKNFMGYDIYDGFKRFFLAPPAAKMFLKSCDLLKEQHPQFKFKVWDSLRPQSIQKKFWNHLEGTAFQEYVANPIPGSLHNYGMAIDLTVVDENENELDMGTDFDDFRPIAQPRLEAKYLQSGELSKSQLRNRLILRSVMTDAGFIVLPHEWWHFNALPKERVYNHYPLLK